MAISDSAAIAVIVAVGMQGAFLAWNAYKITERGNETHEAIGLFLLLMAFVHTIIISTIARTIASENLLADGVVAALGLNYRIAVIVFIIVMVYFILRVMILPMLAANKQKKFKLRED